MYNTYMVVVSSLVFVNSYTSLVWYTFLISLFYVCFCDDFGSSLYSYEMTGYGSFLF